MGPQKNGLLCKAILTLLKTFEASKSCKPDLETKESGPQASRSGLRCASMLAQAFDSQDRLSFLYLVRFLKVAESAIPDGDISVSTPKPCVSVLFLALIWSSNTREHPNPVAVTSGLPKKVERVVSPSIHCRQRRFLSVFIVFSHITMVRLTPQQARSIRTKKKYPKQARKKTFFLTTEGPKGI